MSSWDFTDGLVRRTIGILAGFDIKFCFRSSYCQVSFIYERFLIIREVTRYCEEVGLKVSNRIDLLFNYEFNRLTSFQNQ